MRLDIMPSPQKSALLARLAAQIAALESSGGGATVQAPLPFGVPTLDARLPGGGLARGALHEVIAAPDGLVHDGAAAGFCAALAARLAADGRPVLWCHGRHGLYGPGLAAFGLDPGRLILARPWRSVDGLWAMEEGLRTSALAAVVGEVGELGLTESRRLQLAAETGGVTAILLRATPGRLSSTAAATRWRVAAAPSPDSGEDVGLGPACWDVALLRCRGGRTGAWRLVWQDGSLVEATPGEADQPRYQAIA